MVGKMDNRYYAVVDLEATGNQFNQGNRIIQFACTFIRHDEIVDSFNLFINPDRNIPKTIEKLTGISNQAVKTAPYFFEVASYIKDLLEETVFIAHNANFDFRLLNEELARAGVSTLDNQVVDTVDLSRMLLPRQEIYTLGNLSRALDLNLSNAHDASADAHATAELFLYLKARAKSLPRVTVQQLLDLAKKLNFQSYLLFADTLKETAVNESDYVVVEGIALKQPSVNKGYSYRQAKDYPYTTEEKQKIYQGQYRNRPVQEKMMNLIFDAFRSTDEVKHLAIEAAAGLGKSMGYLFPLFYLVSPERKAIISTFTTTLQHQLLDNDIADLEEVLHFDLSISLLKGRSHYIDLEQFHYLLNEAPLNKSRCIYFGKILVWLTETITGDLDEIFSHAQTLPILSEIRTLKSNEMLLSSKWAPYQFYLTALKHAQEASIVITNHAFLVNDLKQSERQLPAAEYLIIDESHHLEDIIQEASKNYFSSQDFKALVADYQANLQTKFFQYVSDVENEELISIYRLFESNLNYFMYELPLFEAQVISDLAHTDLQKNEQYVIFSEDILSRTKRHAQKCYTILAELSQQAGLSIQIFENQFSLLTPAERALVDAWYEFVAKIDRQTINFQAIINDFKKENQQIWVMMQKNDAVYNVVFETFDGALTEDFKNYLDSVPHLLYTSGTLSVPQSNLLLGQDLDKHAIETYHLDSPYNYAEQARVLVPKDLPSIKEMSSQAYNMWVADAIRKIAKSMDKSMLVLFNSLQALEEVYDNLKCFDDLTDYVLLGQNISGTKRRLLKNFSRSHDKAILLGADSFWEGIDLPGDSLEVIIMTRLPFASPENAFVRSRQEHLKEMGKNPFKYDALPRAQLKFKQGFGRLIRSLDDKGLLFVLDNRFVDANYAVYFQQILPQDTPIKAVDFNQLGSFETYFQMD